jgi:Outer membrane protein beta-barrel domain
MNRDLHDIDELFRSSLEGNEEKPSAIVKKNLDAALDKKDAEEYKKRFIIWKRAALLLLLLLAGFVIYESGLIKKGSGGYTSNKLTPESNKISTDNTSRDNTITNQPVVKSDDTSLHQNQQDNITEPGNYFSSDKETVLQKKNHSNKHFGLLITKQDPLFSIISSPVVKKTNRPDEESTGLIMDNYTIEPLDKRISIAITGGRLTKNIFSLPPFNFSKLPANPNNETKYTQKKNTAFKSFWMINPFVSYDQAGYKLDSDDPLAASNIKHREVHEPSFSGGLLVTRQFSNRWGLQSGLVYTSTQIGVDPQKMYALQLPGGDVAYKFITSSGYAYIKLGTGQPPVVGDSITTSDAKHLLKHITVPLAIKYTVGKNKFTISPSAGIEANFISSAKVEVGVDLASNREIVSVNKLNGIKPFYWSAVAGMEASYQINKKIAVNVQPVFRYALSPITKDNVVETFPRSFGIRAGVTIKFK